MLSTALADGRLLRVDSCLIANEIPSLSNVVAASANGRLAILLTTSAFYHFFFIVFDQLRFLGMVRPRK